MRIGIIAEGKADLAVVTNVIKGITGLDSSDFQHLRPSDSYDETDLSLLNSTTSTWSLVRYECISKSTMTSFFEIEGNELIAIQIDTAEAQDYGVEIPARNAAFCSSIRSAVVEKINEWLAGEFTDKILYAIAVEEIDAWLLTIYRPLKDSSVQPNPKRALEYILGKKGINTTSNYFNFLKLSKPFSKPKEVNSGRFLEFNCSLRLFHQEVTDMWAQRQ